MGSFGDGATTKEDSNGRDGGVEGGFELLGGTLLVEVAVDPSRLQTLYAQVRETTRTAVLDGYADAAAAIAADDGEPDDPRPSGASS